jgi:hypothetical protein
MYRRIVGAWRKIAALTAITGVAALAGLGTLGATGAQATYVGGCKYNWGTPCYIVYGGINELENMDDKWAYGEGLRSTYNGYPGPDSTGHANIITCDTVMYHEGTLSPYPWTCQNEHHIEDYSPGITGYSAIGTGTEMSGLNMYEIADSGEYGPCPAQGNPEC